MKYLLIIFFVITCHLGYSQTYNLTVKITNFDKLKGNIIVSIYDKTSNFPYEGAFKFLSSDVKKNSETVVFKNLKAGEYAIATYHDRNSDGECNRNLLGIPKEGYGFSKNFKPVLSAPSFNDCKVSLNKNKTITINLIN